MKKFTLNLLAFLLLPILFISIPVATLYFSGESLSRIDDDVAKNDKYLIGYAYHESNYKYLNGNI
jgi:hypothetical protein